MLVLPIKKKWFDMILSEEKKEEYREIKPYYTKRFQTIGLLDENGLPTTNIRRIILRNGYSSTSDQVLVDVGIAIREGNPNLGAKPGEKYYVLMIRRKYHSVSFQRRC